MTNQPSSLTSRIVAFAVVILLVSWALNEAAHLIAAALPVLLPVVGLLVVCCVGFALFRHFRQW